MSRNSAPGRTGSQPSRYFGVYDKLEPSYILTSEGQTQEACWQLRFFYWSLPNASCNRSPFSQVFLFTHAHSCITFVLNTVLRWYLSWLRFPFSRSSIFEYTLTSHFIFKLDIRRLNHVPLYSRLIHLFDWMHGGLIDKKVRNKQWVRWKRKKDFGRYFYLR